MKCGFCNFWKSNHTCSEVLIVPECSNTRHFKCRVFLFRSYWVEVAAQSPCCQTLA
ncbi:hypothetical protein CLOSTMETH_02134 [[Clostridium] methylpentosum DSM 5476]|uniref:Uncharacterized protein n=1 Tax=[Clostridium] methylpentosum DSM 5476 TaxID=537013 RepID=C0EE55_9FIRM|nr:hypothetical protein CLOSTMETH_02134 [[Clostridium] methylpentosum DSM 5476]